MVWFSLDVATATDPGRVRARNEDSVAVYTPSADDGSDVLGLTVVADGMGGGQAGDRASALVAERMRAWFASGAYRVWLDAPRNDAASSGSDTEELGVMRRPFGSAYRVGMTRTLRRGLRAVNEEMLALAGSSDDLHGMGSTVVLALFHDHHVWIGHVGDSRCYRIRGGQIELLTRDHTWVHQQVELGLLDAAEAEGHPQRHILLRSLGDTEPPHLDVRIEDLHDGDRFLLCSDGLHGELAHDEILDLAARHSASRALADALVAQAIARGGHDNVTVAVVACCEEEGDPTRPYDSGMIAALRAEVAATTAATAADPDAAAPQKPPKV